MTPHRAPATRGRRAADLSRSLSHEQIERDIAAFRRNGGRIERLGTTRVLTRVDEAATRVPRPAAAVRTRG
jgi:hypothetical protein